VVRLHVQCVSNKIFYVTAMAIVVMAGTKIQKHVVNLLVDLFIDFLLTPRSTDCEFVCVSALLNLVIIRVQCDIPINCAIQILLLNIMHHQFIISQMS